MVACRTESKELCSMEIGVPTNVRHVAHVTFDRFNGFLGLPVEFEPEVPKKALSARNWNCFREFNSEASPHTWIPMSNGKIVLLRIDFIANVFGVSTESMQLSYDSRGNSVPTILLLMQSRLYAQGGLRAEGIFRINGDNTQEDYFRDQLNRGVVPEDIDVHCLAGLIKAWFRELPTAVLDPLDPEQVMECHSEDDFCQLAKLLPPTEVALLDWAINLMVDVVQEENHNKMSARNVAMVFAPNMTQMADPLTALMYAVQVMNFLKTLIEKTLRQREKNSMIDLSPNSPIETSDENSSRSLSQTSHLEESTQEKEKMKPDFIADTRTLTFLGKSISFKKASFLSDHSCNVPTQVDIVEYEPQPVANDTKAVLEEKSHKYKTAQSSNTDAQKAIFLEPVGVAGALEKPRGPRVITHANSRKERVEAWLVKG